MSGTYSSTLVESRGTVATPTDIDRRAVVLGCSSAGSGLSSRFVRGAEAVAAVGYGDAVDTLCHVIEQPTTGQSNLKFPASFYRLPGTTPGSYGAIDNTGVTGTAVPANDASLAPYGTYEAYVTIIAGGTVGTTGITYRWGLDADRSISSAVTTALGTSTAIALPNSGVGFTLDPPSAQVTALIAAVLEARADTLAHLADVTAHDAADTSADQVALAASSAPTTAAGAIAVINLCIAALRTHEADIAAHNGPDGVNTIASTTAVTIADAVARYVAYKAAFNAHLGIALAADTDDLLAATATVAAPVTILAAALGAPAQALMATYARRVSFTTAGATPSDAPATATVTGTDYLGAALVEVKALSQSAATVFTSGAFKTITSIVYTAADGTGATVAIGYGQGVHNSADVTNTLTATSPTQGTLVAGDTFTVRTFAPAPASADIDTAATALANASYDFTLAFFEFDMTAALAARVTAFLDTCLARGKRVTAIVRQSGFDLENGETEAQWSARVAAELSAYDDSRIHARTTWSMITDAMTGRRYIRATLAQFAADTVRVEIDQEPCAPNDRAASQVSLVDSTGADIGHDEGPRGTATGLSNEGIGNRYGCEMRLPDQEVRESVYDTVSWMLYATGESITRLPQRRLANAMEREALSAARPLLGSDIFYTPADPNDPSSQNVMTAKSVAKVHGLIYQRLSTKFQGKIQNADDASLNTGLVQVNPVITVGTGNAITIAIVLAPRFKGLLLSLAFTLTVQP
jgi:hypothetical protein